MKPIISVIGDQTIFNTQAVIEKRYRNAGEVVAKIQLIVSAMLDAGHWHTQETYREVKAKYV